MVERERSIRVHEQFRPVHDAIVRKGCAPPIGGQMRAAVDEALRTLSPEGDPHALRRVDDLLVTGLAWAAATGDTCRIQPAVQAVREARGWLAAPDPGRARAALLSARDWLDRPEPDRRDARPTTGRTRTAAAEHSP